MYPAIVNIDWRLSDCYHKPITGFNLLSSFLLFKIIFLKVKPQLLLLRRVPKQIPPNLKSDKGDDDDDAG